MAADHMTNDHVACSFYLGGRGEIELGASDESRRLATVEGASRV